MRKFNIIVLILILMNSAAVHAAAIRLPQSGQTAVYAPTDDGALRTGTSWPSPRFTDNQDGTVIDNLTGLVWTRHAAPPQGIIREHVAAGDGALSWQQALDCIGRLNAENYLGFSDWRLPNLNELASLIYQGQESPAAWLKRQGFTGIASSVYWTSSTCVQKPDNAWTMDATDGAVRYLSKSGSGRVWPVRGGEVPASPVNLPQTGQNECYDTSGKVVSCAGTGQDGELQRGVAWPLPRFGDNGDQTVTDNLTGLIWPRDANLLSSRGTNGGAADVMVDWQEALDSVHRLNHDGFAGSSDWRLPNRLELASIMNYVEPNSFAWLTWQGMFDVKPHYWTSSTDASHTDDAWNVSPSGTILGQSKSDRASKSFVWPVRGPLDADTLLGKLNASDRALLAAPSATSLSITTASLPAGSVGATYSKALAASGGTTPYAWSRKSGSLPAGLSLSTAGVISGTPTATGTSSFTVQVKDKSKATATKALSITIIPLTITTSALPDGKVSISYSQTLTATGGKSPYTWSCTGGSLPAGVTLNGSTGLISGVPTTAGTSIVTIQVKDTNNSTYTATFQLTVNPAVSIATSTLYADYVGLAYSQTLTANDGVGPYTWSIIDGSLPVGLTLNADTGAISGVPAVADMYSFTVRVVDADHTIADKTLSIEVMSFGTIAGAVTDQATGAPLPGVNVTLTLSGITNRNPDDRLHACNGAPLTAQDYVMTAVNDGSKFICPDTATTGGIMIFKVRNPYGTDPFTVHWNGVSAMSPGSGTPPDIEYNAQSFKPNVSGTLTRVSLYFPNSTSINLKGPVYLLLKSALGGDRGSYLAKSDPVNVEQLYGKAPLWVDFAFSSPVTLVAGQTYYLEINGTIFDWYGYSGYLDNISWGLTDSYAGGTAYERSGGVWKQLGKSLAFQAYMNNQPDIATIPSTSYGYGYSWLQMIGGNDGQVGTVVYSPALNNWYSYATINTSFIDSDGYHLFNGDDLTFDATVNTAPAGYYEPDGWLTVKVWAYGTWRPSLVTDYFDITFNRTLTTVTDANGRYSFPALPDGIYTLTFNNVAYVTGSASGSLAPGQVINPTNTLAKIPPAMLQGKVTLADGSPLAGITVTVTDPAGSRSTVSDVQGNFLVSGVVPGNYTVNFAALELVPQAVAGTLSQGQTGVVNAVMTPAPISLSITTPTSGTLVVSSPLVVTGSVQNADSVTVSTTSNGVVGQYSAVMADGAYTASVPLTRGLVRVDATATNRYRQTGTANLTINFDPRGKVSGIVSDAVTSQPLPAATVTVTDAEAMVRTATTGSDGRYTITELSPGPATVTVSGDGYLPKTFSRTIGQGEALALDVPLATFAVQFVNDVGNVAVMEGEGNYDGKNAGGTYNEYPRKVISTEYFKTHGDVDFLVMLSTFDYAMPEAGAQGFYLPVKNDVQGINQPIADNTAFFGSAGRLQGTIDLGNVMTLAAYPYGPKLDETVATLNHELMHRFGAYVRFRNPDGTLNTALLGKDDAHWSYLLDTQGSLMYGNGWRDNRDGTFTSVAKQSCFSPLDLYLMGMIGKEQVPPMLLIDNPDIDATQLPQLGEMITGTAWMVTIDDIIAAEGARVPDVTNAPKKFNVGFVLLTRPGTPAGSAPAAIETLRSTWAGRFAELTRGIGGVNGVTPSVSVIIDSPADGATITGLDVNVSGTVINTAGAETGVVVNGMVATVSGSRFVVNHVPLQEGANTLTVTATDANGLTSTATRSVTAQAGHYLRIVPNVESGTAPLDISLRLDGSFTIANPSVSITGPVSVSLVPGTEQSEFSATIAVEGTYTITASAVGPDGQTYSNTATITVVSQSQTDTILQEKWKVLVDGLAAENVTNALSVIHSKARSTYQAMITALGGQLQSIAASQRQFNIISVNNRRAKYELITNENGTLYSYEVLFIREGNGLWALYEF